MSALTRMFTLALVGALAGLAPVAAKNVETNWLMMLLTRHLK